MEYASTAASTPLVSNPSSRQPSTPGVDTIGALGLASTVVRPKAGSSPRGTTKKYRLRSQALWMTFAKVEGKTRDAVLASLVNRLRNKVDKGGFILICEEHYKEGAKHEFHFHIAILAAPKKRFQLRSDKYFDDIFGIHGNIRPVPYKPRDKPMTSWDTSKLWVKVRYCLKEGYGYSKYPQTFDPVHYWKQAQLKKNTRIAIVYEAIREDPRMETIDDIDDRFPDLVGMQLKNLEGYVAYEQEKRRRRQKITWNGVFTTSRCITTQAIVDWFNVNLRTYRGFKQKQLWLYGPPDCGKTAMIYLISRTLRHFEIIEDNGWFDGYEDGCFDFMSIDEMSAETVHHSVLKKLAAGYPMKLKRRNNRPVLKTEILPLIVTCQASIDQLYSGKIPGIDVDAIKARFTEIRIDHPLGLVELDTCKEMVLYRMVDS